MNHFCSNVLQNKFIKKKKTKKILDLNYTKFNKIINSEALRIGADLARSPHY